MPPRTVVAEVASAQDRAKRIAAVASDGKAESIVIVDLRGLSTITDFYVIFTGTSPVHLRALGKRIEDEMETLGLRPGSVDGQRGTGWMVYDYGSVIIHAMTSDTRRSYDLERLWGDAPRTEWQ